MRIMNAIKFIKSRQRLFKCVRGAIIIGPFLIIFGADKKAVKTILILSITLTIFLLVLMVIFYLVLR